MKAKDTATARTLPIVAQGKITTATVSVRNFYDATHEALQMAIIAGHDGMGNIIREKSLNRPALALTGYFKHFAHNHLQVFGAGEMAYLGDLDTARQISIMEQIMARKIPGIVIARGLDLPEPLSSVAARFKVPVLRSRLDSNNLIPEATIRLEQLFAPRTNLHATLVDVRGIGVLIQGASGVGKSECALALIERGHSLVADDYVQIELLGDHGLRGTPKDLSRGYLECRGIGIINVGSIYGALSVLPRKDINLVVTFVFWREGMEEERTGIEQHTVEILGQHLPNVILPVRPGRDMARLVEVAAMTHSLRQKGMDPAREFNERILRHLNPATPLTTDAPRTQQNTPTY
ncbi:MAG: HPr(Ser) kinase/phosphatase [Puniceicoccales bacterium]|jgi:HPr kinase/phosphorylase|nr:HPr(Ser) kinase/phosphatase [Puniceicoccales bacterium]